jgi:hypothetical protein
VRTLYGNDEKWKNFFIGKDVDLVNRKKGAQLYFSYVELTGKQEFPCAFPDCTLKPRKKTVTTTRSGRTVVSYH